MGLAAATTGKTVSRGSNERAAAVPVLWQAQVAAVGTGFEP